MEFLQLKFPNMSRTRIKQMLAHEIKVNGKWISQFDFCLQPGMEVERVMTDFRDRAKPRDLKIVFEDAHLLVVDKSSGILSYSRNVSDKTVITELNAYFDRVHKPCHAHIVHRLDRDTSGLLVVAKSKEVARRFEENWKERVYERAYVAVVWGSLEQKNGKIESWLKDGPYCVISSPVDDGGKYAVTHYHQMDSNGRFSLVEFHLDTGRRNQIRVHMRELHHPVVHDPMYGYKQDAAPINRLALHAYKLCFRHPVTDKKMEFKTPIPESFLQLVKRR